MGHASSRNTAARSSSTHQLPSSEDVVAHCKASTSITRLRRTAPNCRHNGLSYNQRGSTVGPTATNTRSASCSGKCSRDTGTNDLALEAALAWAAGRRRSRAATVEAAGVAPPTVKIESAASPGEMIEIVGADRDRSALCSCCLEADNIVNACRVRLSRPSAAPTARESAASRPVRATRCTLLDIRSRTTACSTGPPLSPMTLVGLSATSFSSSSCPPGDDTSTTGPSCSIAIASTIGSLARNDAVAC